MNKKILGIAITGPLVLGGALYFFMRESWLSTQLPSACGGAGCTSVTLSVLSSGSLSSAKSRLDSQLSLQQNTSSAAANPQLQNLESVVVKKYAILFSFLHLSEQARQDLHNFLLKREQALSSPFYDSRSNEAEVAANLVKRNEEIADIDREIEALLSETDIKRYHLLKDSTYEQSQMNGFYELAGAEKSVPEENKEKLLLAKLEQKQSTKNVVDSTGDNIKNAAPATRPYLIEKMRQTLIDEKENYLRNAKMLLNEDQFDLLRDYEQQLFDERWKDITAGLASE